MLRSLMLAILATTLSFVSANHVSAQAPNTGPSVREHYMRAQGQNKVAAVIYLDKFGSHIAKVKDADGIIRTNRELTVRSLGEQGYEVSVVLAKASYSLRFPDGPLYDWRAEKRDVTRSSWFHPVTTTTGISSLPTPAGAYHITYRGPGVRERTHSFDEVWEFPMMRYRCNKLLTDDAELITSRCVSDNGEESYESLRDDSSVEGEPT